MFILRQITQKGDVSNQCIGDRYSVIEKEIDLEGFKRSLGNPDHHPDSDDIYAFLRYESKEKEWLYPMYRGMYYYIMTESGKTFDNISFR